MSLGVIHSSLLLGVGSRLGIDSARLREGIKVFQLRVSQPRMGAHHEPVFAAPNGGVPLEMAF